MNSLYHIKKTSLIHYFQRAKDLAKLFRQLRIQHVKRDHNAQADVLASLATSLTHLRYDYLTIHIDERQVLSPLAYMDKDDILACIANLQEAQEPDQDNDEIDASDDDWRMPFIQHLLDGREPSDPIKSAEMQWRAPWFTLQDNQLYRRSLDGILLQCLSTEEASKVMNEVNMGVCGRHQSGPKLLYPLKRLGYYWPSIVVD